MVKTDSGAVSASSAASVEEAVTLLFNENQVTLEASMPMRQQKAKKTLLKVLGTVVFVAASVIGVALVRENAMNNNTNAIVSMETKSTTAAHAVAQPPAPAVMEAQFGWNDVKNGWCTVRAYTTCIFYSDKDKCHKEIMDRCTVKPEEKSASTDSNGSTTGEEEKAPTREKTTHGETEVPQYTKPAGPVEEDGVGRRLLRIL